MANAETAPTLVVMAAGRGARYGGAKQLEAVGPAGETLLDYAVFDARRAGFTRITIVTRDELLPALDAHRRHFPSDVDVRCAVQVPLESSNRAGKRTRPWGTVHAVLSAGVMDGPIVALNADDFYGRSAYEQARVACTRAVDTGQASVIAMRLDATLSDHGPVVRAVCETDGNRLTRLDEIRDIARTPDGIVGYGGDRRAKRLAGDELVSMNLWILPERLVRALTMLFNRFVAAHAHDRDAELPLPEAIGALVASGTARVWVERSEGPWFGLTHSADRPGVVAAIDTLTKNGVYPRPLWPSRAREV